MYWFSLLFLAFAISLDGFSVGTIYGLRKMHIPLTAILLISACSFLMIIVSMTMGNIIEPVLSPRAASNLGGGLLILIGSGALLQYFRGQRKRQEPKPQIRKQHRLKKKCSRLRIFAKIFRDPVSADLDHSGNISVIEASLLGLALSFDAFGAGISAAFLGYATIWTACIVAFMSGLFLWTGKTIGYRCSEMAFMNKASFIPGLLLIIIGIWKIVTL